MGEALVIKYSVLLLLWKWAGIPIIISSVVGFHLVNKEKQKRGAVIWAPVAWVLTFFWFVFWIGRGIFFT